MKKILLLLFLFCGLAQATLNIGGPFHYLTLGGDHTDSVDLVISTIGTDGLTPDTVNSLDILVFWRGIRKDSVRISATDTLRKGTYRSVRKAVYDTTTNDTLYGNYVVVVRWINNGYKFLESGSWFADRPSGGVTGTVDANVVQWRGTQPNNLVSNRVDASVGAMANNVITASATDTTFVNEQADAIWEEPKSQHTTAGTYGYYLDDAITSRMATYTQPTGFLAATFPSGIIANTTNITAGTITTATNLTTNNDKTNYSLTDAGYGVAADSFWKKRLNSTTFTDTMALAVLRYIYHVNKDSSLTASQIADTTWLRSIRTLTDTTNLAKLWAHPIRSLTATGLDADTSFNNMRDSLLAGISDVNLRKKVWNALLTSYLLKGSTGEVLDILKQRSRILFPIVNNGDLEEDSISSTITGWTAGGTGSVTTTISSKYSGRYGVDIYDNGASSEALTMNGDFFIPAKSWLIFGGWFDYVSGANGANYLALELTRLGSLDTIQINSDLGIRSKYIYVSQGDSFQLFLHANGTPGTPAEFIADNIFAYWIPDTLNQNMILASGQFTKIIDSLLYKPFIASPLAGTYADTTKGWGRSGSSSATINYDSVAYYVWNYATRNINSADSVRKVYLVDSLAQTITATADFSGLGPLACTLYAWDSTNNVALSGVFLYLQYVGGGNPDVIGFTKTNGQVIFNIFPGTYRVFGTGIGLSKLSPDTLALTAGRDDTVYFAKFQPTTPVIANVCAVWHCEYMPTGQPDIGKKVWFKFLTQKKNLYYQNPSDTSQYIPLTVEDWEDSTQVDRFGRWQKNLWASDHIYYRDPTDLIYKVENPYYIVTVQGRPKSYIVRVPNQPSWYLKE